ncbi:4'-phosphopantetheinyl transferase superfamily protein [Streptomyces niveus]|uniref:4'-phosphopantetheinyl transferase superfamily protein n=1 Tax=Streptomyces niveus TaxID=193462 RepID=UPI0039A69654
MTADCGTLHFEEAARVTVVPYADGLIALCTTAIAAPEGPEARARERRQAEHAAGQYALITSLAALGVHAGPPDRRPDGSPRPPPGTLVSISHRFPYAVAAAWKAHGRPPQHCRILGVGVDIEQEGTIPENAVHLVCSPVERPGLCATPGWADPTRVFSGKEAAYKADPQWRSQRFAPRRLRLRPLGPRLALAHSAAGPADATSVVASRQVGGYWISLCITLTAARPSRLYR